MESYIVNLLNGLLFITFCMRIPVIIFLPMLGHKNTIIKTAYLVILGIYVASEILSLIFHIINIIYANNSPDDSFLGAYNVCNDYRYCCVYPGPANPVCPVLLAPCVPARDKRNFKNQL